jgi:hypothetical protein
MAKEIGTEWIQIALESGGHIDIQMAEDRTIMARVRWRHRDPVMGAYCKTVSEAIDSLDTCIAREADSATGGYFSAKNS